MSKELIKLDTLSSLSNIEITKEVVVSADFGARYAMLKEAIDALSSLKKDLDSKILDIIVPMYEEDGTINLSNEKYSFTYCAPTVSLTVDSAKLKKEFPEVYKQCVKTSTNRSASLRVLEKKAAEKTAA